MRKILIIILLQFFGFGLFAQNPQQIIDYADRLYERNEYLGAAQFYRSAMEIDSGNTYLLYQLGSTYSNLNQLDHAAYYLEKVSRTDWEGAFPTVDFELAEVYFKLGKHRYAERYYRKALRPYRRDQGSEWYKRISKRMASVDFAVSQNVLEASTKVEQIKDISSFDSEFSPIMMNDSTLLFSSLRADSLGTNDRINDKDYHSRIYKSQRINDTSWTEAELLPQQINIPGWDIANPAFDHRNMLLYFSKCDSSAKCTIWRSKLINGQFQAAEKLGSSINEMGSNNTQAFPVQLNGKEYLFFVSDRKGGQGQLDIWYAQKNENGHFGPAVNAGENINSIDNEITPFYSVKEQKLYFSSNWHTGFGGYDIFYSKGLPGSFTEVKNNGSKINSSMNDYYFSLGEKILFFVSDRNAIANSNCCCNNIYTSEYQYAIIEMDSMEKHEVALLDTANSNLPKVISVDIINQYLPVELYFHNDYPDPNSWDTTTTANYEKLVKDYLALEEEYQKGYSSSLTASEIPEAQEKIASFFEKEVKEGFDKLEFFMPMLHKELEKGNNIKMTIKGYASSISGKDYNLNLTLRRIESLINYLKEYKHGILKPYIDGTAKSGGTLSFIKLPFGEYVNPDSEGLSGKMKIYSPMAARNRKIEILAVTESADGSISLDGSKSEPIPKISFNSSSYQLKLKANAKVSPTFLVKNNGMGSLKIYAVDVNCDCASVEYSKSIDAGEEGKISIDIDTKNLSGKKTIDILVITNAVPNLQKLKIHLLIEN